MSKLLTAVVASVILALSGCSGNNAPPPPSKAQTILEGEHKLRKMVERTDVKTSTSGGFFLFVGGFESSVNTSVTVKFAWQMNDGTYAISSLPLEKFRIKFDEQAKTPTIKFRWERYSYAHSTPTTQQLMNKYVVYALLTVRERDWPISVRLPMSTH